MTLDSRSNNTLREDLIIIRFNDGGLLLSQSVRATTDHRGSINPLDVDQRRSRSISVLVNAGIE